MIANNENHFELNCEALHLCASAVPWDRAVFGSPVAAIFRIDVKTKAPVKTFFDLFKAWVDEHGFNIVSCRLPHDSLDVSMMLEENDFKFIEMVLHPIVSNLQDYPVSATRMVVDIAREFEIPSLVAMAERSFGNERYHMDPRLDSRLADIRYGRWIKNSFHDVHQELLKISLDGQIIGFFVVETQAENTIYWHLTAVAPDFQGKKLGHQIWQAVINHHKLAGIEKIRTTISARNSPVLNLYSKLNFRFEAPEMTFHWVRPTPQTVQA